MKFTSPFKIATAVAVLSAALGMAGSASAATAELFGSTGNFDPAYGAVAIDSSGTIFTAASVPNTNTKSIVKITSSGTVTTQWTSALPDYSAGVAVGPDGTVFSGQSATIVKLDASGGLVASYANNGPAATGAVAVNASTGDAYWISGQGKKVGRIPGGSSTGNAPTPVTTTETPCAVITDASGNVYVGTDSEGKVLKYDSSLTTLIASYTVGQKACSLAVDATYLYVANKNSGSVSRITLSDDTTNATWANLGSLKPTYIAVDSSGYVYTANVPMGFGNSTISKISPAGTPAELYAARSQMDVIKGLVVDAATNVYFTQGAGMTPNSAGVYKIVQAAPSPTPTPTPTSSSTTLTTTTTGKPAPGPALKVTDIPAEFTLNIGSSTGGTIPADQPITAEVPCTAPEGQLLDRCTVNVTAPEYVLLGQGDGINVRSDKKVSIGKATVKAKAGKKVIVVKVKINGKGRKALQRNLKITATVGLTAITVSNLKSTGEANTEMRLPTQLISPQSGIFDSNSITLNKAGIAFVNRLAALLPKTPKQMTFIGFADNTGVPGDNRWLGDRRAKAVRDALEAKGITAAKSSIETKAARSPRDDNAKQSGRERNRRVSIRITY